MKALKIILIVLVVLVGGYALWMATLPSNYKVERTAVIDAKPEAVYATVSDFTTWNEWSKWHKMDPEMEIKYGDVKAGEGATYSWKGEKAGAGTQTITKAVPNESIETHVTFEGMGEMDGQWIFEPVEENQTRVTWTSTGEFPFFFRVMSLGMDEAIGKDFEEGLSNLKTTVESMPKNPAVEIEMTTMEPMPYYGIKHDISWEELNSDFFGANYTELMTYLGDDGANMSMAPFAIFYEWDMENKRTVVEPGIAVNSKKPGNDRIKKGMTHGGQALKAVHMGGYDTEPEHNALTAYMEKNGLTLTGGVMEVYVTDPTEEPDTAKWITEIYYPVQPAEKASGETMEEKK